MLIVVIGTLAGEPWAGMAWMHLQIVAGLRRLGHDAWYFETTSAWPYNPHQRTRVPSSDYALPYLARASERFGLGDRWAYRRSYSDKAWFGLPRARAEDLLARADLVLNVAGATRLAEEGFDPPFLAYLGTDPGVHEIGYANGDPWTVTLVDEHDACVTYGENIGTPRSPIPPLPGLRGATRQAVLLDLWQIGAAARDCYTTVANWRQEGRDLAFNGRIYHWSKHHEFLPLAAIPERAPAPLELALSLDSLTPEERGRLEHHGWRVIDANGLSSDPFAYRDYVVASRGEFTVAKDLNVRLASGWFSERSACYLAAGRPVVTQDTGFGDVLPVGEGLLAFRTPEEALAALETIESDYDRHARSARAIAEEYFRAETVLVRLIDTLSGSGG